MRPGKPSADIPLIQLRTGRTDQPMNVELPDGTAIPLERRDFLRIGAVAAAAAGLAGSSGCAPAPEQILPIPVRAEDALPGVALQYASTCFGCPAGCGVIVKTREGRVVKVEGNTAHPINQGTLCARGHATVLDLYDPDRARQSAHVFRSRQLALPVSNAAIDQDVIAALTRLKAGARVRLLTGTVHGPAMRALIESFMALFPGSEHVAWEPLSPATEVLADAWYRCFGERIIPTLHFDRADVIVSLGSEFLDTWLSPLQFARDFGRRRNPDQKMSKLWALEGRMSLTGSNADRRIRVRPSQLPDIALALAHEIIVVRKHGALASDSEAIKALSKTTIDQVAPRVGVGREVLREIAKDLIDAAGASLVVGGGPASTGPHGLALEIGINLLNAGLGNIGSTLDPSHPSNQLAGRNGDLARLTHEMRSGKVDALIVAGSNPAYSAPAVLGMSEAILHVPTVICVSDRVDETTRLSDFHCAATHPMESWLDAEPVRGTIAVCQPAMRPMGEMRSLSDLLVQWGAALGASDLILVADNLARDRAGTSPSGGYHFIREFWRSRIFPRLDQGRDFETFWRDVLHAGVVSAEPAALEGARTATESRTPLAGTVAPTFRGSALNLPDRESTPSDIELVLFAPHAMYDGRGANNGWLQEYPDPVARVTWDAWVAISRVMMASLGLVNGDLVDVTSAGWTLRFAAFEQAGNHDNVIAIPLGYGRSAAGEVGNGVGANGYQAAPMTSLGPRFAGQTASLRKTGSRVELAIPQGESVIDLNQRPLIPVTTLAQYRNDPTSGTEAPEHGVTIWPKYAYPELKWGMAIDLSACIGCGACTIACQAENNIPTAGRKGVIRGREMHWLRVDRYYRMPIPRHARNTEEDTQVQQARDKAKSGEWLDNPDVLFHPVMCQHCENAPCETVCPVGATSHSTDGLNMQVYNRCVGTRYCSNNCPFKARRFNWFDYSREHDSLFARIIEPAAPMISRLNARWPQPYKYNPEVTVRSRGVMEKCTFCVQRLAVGRHQAKDANRKLQDGDAVTACQQTCPTGAIKFGNLADPSSEVSRLAASKRGLRMLEDQNVGSSVTYLSKVRNES